MKNTTPSQFSHLPAPEVDFLHSMPTALKGGSEVKLQFKAKSTSVLGVQYQKLEYSSDNGKTYTELAKLDAGDFEYTWTVPMVDVSQAVIRLTAYDKLGYSSQGESPVFRIISTQPTFTENQQSGSVINNQSSISYGGSCTDGLTIVVVTSSGNDQVVCNSGHWNYTDTSNVDGTTTYQFYQSDAVGNQTDANRSWTRDTVPPSLTQNLVPSPVTNNLNQVTFGGGCESGLVVNVSSSNAGGSQSTIPCNAGSWSYVAGATSDGSRNYQFSASDTAGNAATPISVTWIRDTVPPVLTQNLVPSSVTNNLTQITVGGSCESGLAVRVVVTGASPVEIPCAGIWSYIASTSVDGTKTITISQVDLAGNAATPITVSWTRQTTPVVLTQTLVASPVTNKLNQITMGGACVTGLIVKISWPDGTPVSQVICSGSSWSYTASASSDGSRTYRLSENDNAGNSAPTIDVVWNRDTVAPVLTQVLLASPLSNGLSQVIYGGNCEAGLQVNVAPSAGAPNQVSCDAGAWTYVAGATADGTRSYVFSETDAAGNSAAPITVQWTRTTATVETKTLDYKGLFFAQALFVLDNSGSMDSELANYVQSQILSFMSGLNSVTGLSYNMAFTNTDELGFHAQLFAAKNGQKIITQTSTSNIFTEIWSAFLKEGGFFDSNERGLAAAESAIGRDGSRIFSAVSSDYALSRRVVIISDANDHSQGSVSNNVQRMRGVSKLSLHPIIAIPGHACTNPTQEGFGQRYVDAVNLVGGSVSSICRPDFAASLNSVFQWIQNVCITMDSPITASNDVHVYLGSNETTQYTIDNTGMQVCLSLPNQPLTIRVDVHR